MTSEEYIKGRREAAERLDPETAIVFSRYVYVVDPYGVHSDLSPEEQCIGREVFAFSPTEGAVWFGDLPDKTRKRLEEREKPVAFDEDGLPF